MTHIAHNFDQLKTSPRNARKLECGGTALKGCICENCKEARARYVYKPKPYVGESFEDWYEKTEQGRRRVLSRVHAGRELERKEAHDKRERQRILREQRQNG